MQDTWQFREPATLVDKSRNADLAIKVGGLAIKGAQYALPLHSHNFETGEE